VPFLNKQQYGLTQADNPSEVLVQSYLLERSKVAIHNYRKCFIAFATIMHERAHGKNYQFGTGYLPSDDKTSPVKVFPAKSSRKGESGSWLEISLFDGIVYSCINARDVSGAFSVKISIYCANFKGGVNLRTKSGKFMIPDRWIIGLVCTPSIICFVLSLSL
jgi:hypothetical protein